MRSLSVIATYLTGAVALVAALVALLVFAEPATGAEQVTAVAVPDPGQPGRVVDDKVVLPDNGGFVFVPANEPGKRDVILAQDNAREPQRRIQVRSMRDLAGLDDDELRRLERGEEAEIDRFALRRDVNSGLFGLGQQIRGLDFSYRISPVRNAAGTAWTAGSGSCENCEYEFVPAPVMGSDVIVLDENGEVIGTTSGAAVRPIR